MDRLLQIRLRVRNVALILLVSLLASQGVGAAETAQIEALKQKYLRRRRSRFRKTTLTPTLLVAANARASRRLAPSTAYPSPVS
jgi:hypothetical protein